MNQTAHTPTPWNIRTAWGDDSEFEIYPEREVDFGDPAEIAVVKIYDETQENAEFIVKAVNAHDELVDTVRNARNWIIQWISDYDHGLKPTRESLFDVRDGLEAALAKAGAK